MKQNDVILAANGFVSKFEYDPKVHKKPNKEQIELCAGWIRKFGKKQKNANFDYSSYGLKHKVEKWCGIYVTNGAFIKAAIDLGYKYFFDNGVVTNPVFNINLKLPEDNWKRVRPIGFSKWLFGEINRNDKVGRLAQDAFSDNEWPRRAGQYVAFRLYLDRKAGASKEFIEALDEAWYQCFQEEPPYPNEEIENKCYEFYSETKIILDSNTPFKCAPKNMKYLYVLLEPESDESLERVRYVGVTSNPIKRLKRHIVCPGNIEKVIWTGDLLRRGLTLCMGIVGLFDEKEINYIEQIYILSFYEIEKRHRRPYSPVLFNVLSLQKYRDVITNLNY